MWYLSCSNSIKMALFISFILNFLQLNNGQAWVKESLILYLFKRSMERFGVETAVCKPSNVNG